MSKYQEANRYIDMIWSEPSWSRVDIDWLAIEQIKEILDKETPMKRLYSWNTMRYHCPKCKEEVITERCNCGQKVDWSDEE